MHSTNEPYEGRNYVNGEWKREEGVPTFVSLNPSTEESLGDFPITEKDLVNTVVDSAQSAFFKWRNISRVQRADYFDRLAQLLKRDHDVLVRAISLETGKNLNESHAEVIEALHMCQVAFGTGRIAYGEKIASEISTKDAEVVRKPKGVIAVISPWNFPVAIGGFWSTAPAIVEGNCVVWKPSEYTPMCAQLIAQLYDEAGFPPGVFNMIHGMGETGKELAQHPLVKHVLFTGSAEVGREIAMHCASVYGKGCSYETGSKSAVMIFKDGNLDLALEACVASAFKLSGQRCVSSGRILIDREIYRDFTNAFAEKVKQIRTGDPFNTPAPYYGPLINKEQLHKVSVFNVMVQKDKDCELLTCDYNEDLPKKGYFKTPLVYRVEWADKPFLKNEVFGPHVALIPFDSVEHAIDIYNDTEYGLALGVITEDFRIMRRCRDECNAGMLYLNGGSIAAESHLPFGGIGKSGNGWKSAAGTYRAVTEEIAVTTNYEHKMSWAQGMKS